MCHLLLSCGFPADKIRLISLSSRSLYLWSTRTTRTPILPHNVRIPAGPVLQSLNTLNNYLSSPKLAATPPPSPPMSLSLYPSLPSFPSLLLSLIFPLPFPDSGLNRMLILTGGFQSRGSSFSSWCAPQVHQHKVTLLFKKEVVFSFLSVFTVSTPPPSLLSHLKKDTRHETLGKAAFSR